MYGLVEIYSATNRALAAKSVSCCWDFKCLLGELPLPLQLLIIKISLQVAFLMQMPRIVQDEIPPRFKIETCFSSLSGLFWGLLTSGDLGYFSQWEIKRESRRSECGECCFGKIPLGGRPTDWQGLTGMGLPDQSTTNHDDYGVVGKGMVYGATRAPPTTIGILYSRLGYGNHHGYLVWCGRLGYGGVWVHH